jgi:hypothetical protein
MDLFPRVGTCAKVDGGVLNGRSRLHLPTAAIAVQRPLISDPCRSHVDLPRRSAYAGGKVTGIAWNDLVGIAPSEMKKPRIPGLFQVLEGAVQILRTVLLAMVRPSLMISTQ